MPQVLDYGVAGAESFIEIEWLEFDRPTRKTEQALGERLATLHRHTADRFGWIRDNTIGLTPQVNQPSDNWIDFFREHRLEYQLKLAAANGYGGALTDTGRRLADRLQLLFDGYEPAASLLHGDLWGGNWGSVDGEPVIFDPAVYYGDRESDIAMTMLFGGFGRAFYDAYSASWPLAGGHEQRFRLYQLYHVLNHLNLFGNAYLRQAEALLCELQ